MASINGPIRIHLARRGAAFWAVAFWRVGNGAERRRIVTRASPTAALAAMLAVFRKNGHAGKRYAVVGYTSFEGTIARRQRPVVLPEPSLLPEALPAGLVAGGLVADVIVEHHGGPPWLDWAEPDG